MPEQKYRPQPAPNVGALPNTTPSIAWWIRLAVVLGALLMATGAVLALVHPAMLVSPGDEINGAVRIYAGYLASRNMSLAIMLIALLSFSAKRALSSLMVLVALIQALDACIDAAEGRWPIVPGVIIFAIVFLAAAARLAGYPPWKSEFWPK